MSSLIAKYYADRENFGSDGCIPVAVVGISSSESVVVGIGSESVVGGGSVMGAELAVGTSSEGTGSESVVGGGSVMGGEVVVGTGSVVGKGVARISLGTTDLDGDCSTPL